MIVKRFFLLCLFHLAFFAAAAAQDSLLRTGKPYLIAYVFIRLDNTTARVRIDNGTVETLLKDEKNATKIFPTPAAVLNHIAAFGWELCLSEHNRKRADDAYIYYFRRKE